MADTLESLELEVKHKATGAATEIKEVANAVRSLSRALDKVAPGLIAFSNGLGSIGVSVTNNINPITNISNTVNKVTQSASKATTATKNTAKAVKDVGKAAQKAQGPLSGFVSSLKRIAFYRIIRSIIKAITEALKEGLENAYLYSKQVGGDLAPAMDRLASSTQKLKNQLGAAFGQLLLALEPILEVIIWLVTKLAEAITWLFALLSGADTYLVANDVTKSWQDTEDATNGATKAAKEYKNQLLGFDEINKLTAPDDSGRGKNGNDGDDASGLFREVPMNWKLPDITGWLAPLAGAVPPILDLLGQLVSEIELLGLKWEELAGKTENAWGRIVQTVQTWGAQTAGAVQSAWNWIVVSTQTAWANVTTTVSTWISQAWSNILTFATVTIPAWKEWAKNVASMAAQAFTGFATSVYQGLQNAADNVVTFVNATAQAIYSWAKGALNSVVSWANGVAQSVASALASAWENFKNFMTATGQAISGWWHQNRGWVVPVAITAAVVIGAVALAPYTGGMSLGAIALAADGGMFDQGQMFIAREAGPEMVGTIGGKTAVANNDQIVEAVSRGVFQAVSEAMSMNGSGSNRAVVLNINGREFMRATYNDQRAVAKEHGVSLIAT